MADVLDRGKKAKTELCRRSLYKFLIEGWHVLEPNVTLETHWHIKTLCDHVQWMYEQWGGKVEQVTQNLAINVPPGTLKPCYVEGMITEKHKGLIRLDDVVTGDLVLTHKGRFREVMAVADQGVLPLVRIQTKRGRVIKVAEDHPMLTARGWIEAGKLDLQDTLFAVHGEEGCGTDTVTHETARLLGYLIGDGCTSQSQAATFTNQDPETLEDFDNCCESQGFETSHRVRPPSYPNKQNKLGLSSHVVSVKVGAKNRKGIGKGKPGPVRMFVRKYGLEGATSYTKHVPSEIFQASDGIVADFLAAYWACDGGISDRRDLPRPGRTGQTSNTIRVDATTVSEDLARGLQALLARLGMAFTVRKRVTKLKSKRQGDFYTSWHIVAENQDTVAKFCQIIKPRIKHEKRGRAQGTRRVDVDRVLNADPIVSIDADGDGRCKCLQVDEDSSFSYQGVAVHNSRIVSVYGPAWAWLHWPEMSMLCLSSTPEVARRDADYNKELIQSEWYRETFEIQWEVRHDADAKGLFKTTAGGCRQSQGINAKIVGIRRDCLIFDDPNDIKDRSETKLTSVAQGWVAARNRLNDLRRGFRIIIQQRVHEMDLTGIVLTQGIWDHLCIPMEYTEALCACKNENCDTKLGKKDPRTEPGEVLQPIRNTPEVLAGELAGLGSIDYACQLNQRAAPEGGAMFKDSDWLDFDELPRDKNRRMLEVGKGLMSVDCTFGEGKAGKPKRDRVAIVVIFPMGKATRYVYPIFAKRMGIKDTIKKIKEIYEQFVDPEHGGYMINKILIEAKANGEAVIELLEDVLPGVVPFQPKGDKVSRANACLPTVEARNVLLKRDGPFTADFKAELGAFPNGANDDFVDAFTQGMTELHAPRSDLDKLKKMYEL